MDSRQQFETSPRFRGMDFTRSVTHPEYYESPYANGALDGWQAARELLIVELRAKEQNEWLGSRGFHAGWTGAIAFIEKYK